MTTKMNRVLTLFVSIILFSIFTNQSFGQSAYDKLKAKAKEKADKAANDISNGKKQKETENKSASDTTKTTNSDNEAKKSSKIPSEQSIIKEADFVQNAVTPPRNPNYTRIKIADNLMVDVKGKYPTGYAPNWRFINNKTSLNFSIEQYITAHSSTQNGSKNISITSYNGKAVLLFSALINASLYADIVTKDSVAVLTETPQTFKVTNFQQIINGKPSGQRYASTNNMYFSGGFEGEITLSANENGDIKMELMIESFKNENRFREAGVSYRHIARDVNIENLMSAEKANGIVKAEEEAKQRQKDYVIKMTKQADSLQKLIVKNYPQKDCKECFYSSKGSYISSSKVNDYWVNGYGEESYAGSHTDYDVNTVIVIKNKCNYPLTFIGIQQFYDEQNGYYLKEVTKTMDVGYSYSSDQGAFASVLTSILGAGSEFDFPVQGSYAVNYAHVGSVQWLKVIKN